MSAGTIPFGKHKGMPWSEAPQSYLEWLSGWDGLRDNTRAIVDDELRRRRDGGDEQNNYIDEKFSDERPVNSRAAEEPKKEIYSAELRTIAKRLEWLAKKVGT